MSYTISPGVTTSTSIENFKKQETLEWVDINTYSYMDFVDAVIPQNINILDVRFQMPRESVIPPFRIGDEGQSVVRQRLGFFDTGTSLYGYKAAVEITDAAKVRGDYNMQWSESMKAVANGMAEARDYEILTALYNGAANSVNADTTWDDEGGKNILGDVAAAVRKIFKNKRTNIKTAEMQNMVIYYPAHLMMDVDLPEMFYNSGSSGGNFGYNIPGESQSGYLSKLRPQLRPTARLNEETFAIGIMKSNLAAVHYSYNGPDMPRAEDYRDIEKGSEGYMLSQWFRTHVRPQSYTQQNTSDRIFIINGVASA